MKRPQGKAHFATVRIHVDALTDEQLLTAILKTNDPMSLEGIANTPPPEDCDLWYEMNYEADRDVKCVHGHSHKKGIILRDAKGNRYPIGHTCGEGYGLDWVLLENATKKLRERKDYLLRLQAIGRAIRAEQEWLSNISEDPAVLAFDSLRQTFRVEAKSFFLECANIARGNGQLWAEFDERDFAAEEHRRERDAERMAAQRRMTPAQLQRDLKNFGVPGTDKTPIFKKVSRTMGALPGASLFLGGETLRGRVSAFVAQIHALADTCLQIPNCGDLAGISKLATRTFNDFSSALKDIENAAGFFDYSNLARTVEWANKADIDGLKFSIDGTALRIQDHEEKSVRISQPLKLNAIDTSGLSKLLASLLKAP